MRMVDRVGNDSRSRRECPAFRAHIGVDGRQSDHGFEPFEAPIDQCSMCPGTSQRYVKMISVRFGLKAVFATRAGAAIGCDPVAKLCLTANEAPLRLFGVVPDVVPFAVD